FAQVADNVIQSMKAIAGWSNGAVVGGRESDGETGTHQLGDTGLNKDTWMVGSTPQVASAVWVGAADNASAVYKACSGVSDCAGVPTQIWKQILDTSLADAEWESFPQDVPVSYGFNELSNATAWDPSWNSTPSTDSSGTTGGTTRGGGAGGEATREEETDSGTTPSPDAGDGARPSDPPEGGDTGGDDGGGGNAPAPPAPPSVDDVIGDLEDIFG